MTLTELTDYLLTELPNTQREAEEFQGFIMQLPGERVRILVQCGDADCVAEMAYQSNLPPRPWPPVREDEPPFDEIRRALDNLTPPLAIVDQDPFSILVNSGETFPDHRLLRIAVSRA